MIRDDLSDRLIHLTRGEPKDSVEKFLSIIKQKKLVGSNIFIRGSYRCVCFSEAPISKITQILADPNVHDMRYAPFGILVSKLWLYKKGGRPVIYQSEDEYELLPEILRYKHVRYEPHKDIDFSWEREWRIQTEELLLDPSEVTLVVPTRSWEEYFHESHLKTQKRETALYNKDAYYYLKRIEWHFVVLEDLGYSVTWPSPSEI